ncbi:MAG: hypothetical protein LH471_01140 [Salinibacterium sp.]|nr:hypothetical protein [Salinibacterium sp.]
MTDLTSSAPLNGKPSNREPDNTEQVDAHQLASDNEKIDGLIEQIRQDALQGTVPDLADELRRRLADSGIELERVEFERALAAVRQPPTA